MDPERWQQVNKVLIEALGRDADQRKAFLEEVCRGDEELLLQVEALLAADKEAGSFLQTPPGELAAQALGQKPHQSLAGQRLGPYEILSLLGRGGMGEVYRARDTRLDRIDALKILLMEVAADSERLRRFVREAKAASALNHPNIATIYEIGESDGIHWIAMELVEGQTLADRMKDRPLKMEEILDIGIQTAEALEAAHKKGIIHRDIKPANLMMTPEGRVKILDFGSAKITRPYGQASAVQGSETQHFPGLVMGTARYMSPEQVLGQPVDQRTDIFSLGVVLYEMATGQPPFAGETPSAIFEAILHQTPDWPPRVQTTIPKELQRIINKAVEKFREMRYQTALDLCADLKRLKLDTDSGRAAMPVEPSKSVRIKRPARSWKWVLVAAALVLVAGIGTYVRFVHREAALPSPRFVPVTNFPGLEEQPTLSPDGRWVAFEWNGEKQDNWDIYVKDLDGPGFNRLTSDPAEDRGAAWSPDGRQIAFLRRFEDRKVLYLTSPLGGGERKITELGIWSNALSWAPDGKNIAFTYRQWVGGPGSFCALALDTLEKKQLFTPEARTIGRPTYSPDGRHLAFLQTTRVGASAIYVMRLPHGEPRLVTDFDYPQCFCWTADSREIVFRTFSQEGRQSLWRVPIEGGQPMRVPTPDKIVDFPSVRRNRLVYVSATGNSDIWKLDLTGPGPLRPPSKPLISWTSNELGAAISHRGDRIAFCSDRSGFYDLWVCASGGSKAVQVTDLKSGGAGSPAWSPDDRTIAFDSLKSGNADIYLVDPDGGPVRQITNDTTAEFIPRWSHDGRWIYFGSNRSGSSQIWRMPAAGGKATQITHNGGFAAFESADGKYVYYDPYGAREKGIYRVSVSGGPETLVTEFPEKSHVYWLNWDLTNYGIYLMEQSPNVLTSLCFFDFSTNQMRILGPLSNASQFDATQNGMKVSPDGKWLVYGGGIYDSDIMLIENFR